MKRILWNRRPSPCVAGDIDEIVLTDVSTGTALAFTVEAS